MCELSRSLLRGLAVGDVAERHQFRRLAFPLGVDHPQFRIHHFSAPSPDDLHLRRLARRQRRAERRADERIRRLGEETPGGGVGEANDAAAIDDHDAVRQAVDDRAQPGP